MPRFFFALLLLTTSASQAAPITDVRVSGAGPVTFGQVFAVGDMKKSDVLVGKLDGATVPLQVDVKATHADGSVRHAIISAQVPKAGTIQLDTGGAAPAAVLSLGTDLPSVTASATIGGIKYIATSSTAGKATWLQGSVVSEWQTVAPLTTAAGAAHSHLTARFAVRYYTASKKTRVDVTIENAWAYEPGPQNFTYDADITVGGKSVYRKAGLTHYHHARWRKVFWDGPTVQHNTAYLIASKVVPNYDRAPGVAESLLATYANVASDPMTIGLTTAYMPTTGAHIDIGILPQWQAAYVLSMDARARDATQATADGAGSFPIHYRDRATDRPVSLANRPRMTIAGRTTDAGADAFPGCTGDCTTPYTPDVAHQPSLAYLPYLLTGDYFYLEEMQFWGMYDAFNDNPNYRGFEKGLVNPGQLRGQAWALRTIAQAAYLTPDADPLKKDFVTFVDNNLDWYNTTYAQNPTASKLGVMAHGYSMHDAVNVAPWMDDFFTSAVGYAVDLGFEKAKPLLLWKAQFTVGRMMAPGVCWIDAAVYDYKVRDSATSPLYSTFAQAYVQTVGAARAATVCPTTGDMGNISNGTAGYPSNMQPALAYAVDSSFPGAKEAWTLFANRTVKPDYSTGPQFSIVPRDFVAVITTPAAPAAPSAPATPAAPVPAPAAASGAPTVAGTWAKIATEGAKFTVSADTAVRYGAGGNWIYSKGSGTASNVYFGKDPALGLVKAVEAFTPTPAAKPGAITAPTSTKLAKFTGLTVAITDPVTRKDVLVAADVAATVKGAFTITNAALAPKKTYAYYVYDKTGAFVLTNSITAK